MVYVDVDELERPGVGCYYFAGAVTHNYDLSVSFSSTISVPLGFVA